MHWIWVSEARGEDALVFFDTPPIVDELSLRFDTGVPLPGSVPAIHLQRDDNERGGLTDNLLAPGVNGLVFSERLRQLLAASGVDNIQYFDCTLRSADGFEIHDYRIANIVGRVSCVDHARSVLELDVEVPGHAVFIDSLALAEEHAAGFDLFRLHEDSTIVIASDRVRRICEQAQITGVRFCHPAEFCF